MHKAAVSQSRMDKNIRAGSKLSGLFALKKDYMATVVQKPGVAGRRPQEANLQ